MTSSRAWDFPASFLGSLEQEGEVTKGRRCSLGTLTQPLFFFCLPNRFSWRYQLREFQSRFHVVAVDLRGYGSSDAPKDVDCYTIDLLMADIQDVILGLGGDLFLSQAWSPSPTADCPLRGISLQFL